MKALRIRTATIRQERRIQIYMNNVVVASSRPVGALFDAGFFGCFLSAYFLMSNMEQTAYFSRPYSACVTSMVSPGQCCCGLGSRKEKTNGIDLLFFGPIPDGRWGRHRLGECRRVLSVASVSLDPGIPLSPNAPINWARVARAWKIGGGSRQD